MSAFGSVRLAERAAQAYLGLGAAFLLLVGAFFRLQILQHEAFAKTSAAHRLRELPLPAPRGDINDRHGTPIALNVPGYSIQLIPQKVVRPPTPKGVTPIPVDTIVKDSLRAVVNRIRALVPGDSIDVGAVIRRYEAARFRPVLVLASGSDSTVAILEEHRAILPGLLIENEPKRYYPAGAAVAHLVGYLGEVSQAEIDRGRFRISEIGDLAGKDGLEFEYDSLLRGRRGTRFVEVTASGFVVRNALTAEVRAPIAGTAIQTTIDLPLQLFIDSLWRADLPDKSGAMVAMTPAGEVLAYLSFPAFDPNAFIARSNPAAVRDAFTNPRQPMFNRAIAGRYPPASPWKLVMAIMALKRGVATMDTRMRIPCNGGYRFGNRTYGCWKHDGHGSLTLAQAIATSCDVYFYQLGQIMGREALFEDGVAMGFRTRSGIDLERESPSAFPILQDYIKSRGGWSNGEVLNLSIGQGRNQQSLINMVAFYAALASDGVKRAPYIYRPRPGAPSWDYQLSAEQLLSLREALVSVVNEGTAAASGGRTLEVAGKTGTGQMTGQENMGWFIGFAPWREPKVVIGIAVEEGLHGSSVAGHVVKAIGKYLGMDETGVVIPVTEDLTTPPDSVTGDSSARPRAGQAPAASRGTGSRGVRP